MKRFLFSLIFLVTPTLSFADPPIFGSSTIKGVFLDVNNQPISDATVTLVLGIIPLEEVQTDENGAYSFDVQVLPSYVLQFSKPGYITTAASVRCVVDKTSVVNCKASAETPVDVTVNVVDIDDNSINLSSVFIVRQNILYGSGTTDASGLVTFSGLSNSGNYNAVVTKSAFQTSVVSFQSSETPNTVKSVLKTSPGTIEGKVTISENPAYFAIVEYLVNGVVIALTFTDLNGMYNISEVPSGVNNIRVTYMGYQQRSIPVFMSEGEAKTGVDVALAINPTITNGVIYNAETREPLQGAYVNLWIENTLFATFLTSLDGSYIFTNAPTGNNLVQVFQDGYSSQAKGLTLGASDVGSMEFASSNSSPKYTVTGFATPYNEVSDVSIYLFPTGSMYYNVMPIYPFLYGEFQIQNVSAGNYNLLMMLNNYPVYPPNEATAVSFNIQSTGSIGTFATSAGSSSLVGEVRDLSSGETVSNAVVQVSTGKMVLASTTSNQNGEYYFQNLLEGSVVVTAKFPSNQAVSNTFTFVPGETITHYFELPGEPNTLVGVVYDALTGSALSFPSISLNNSSYPFASWFGAHLGDFSFEGICSGTYTLSAKKSEYISAALDPFTFTGSGEIITKNIYLYPIDAPPRNVEGNIVSNNYGASIVDIIHTLYWEASLSPEVVSYNVYADGVLIGNVSATSLLVFNQHNQNKNISTTYLVKSVNSDGSLSSGVEVILR